MAALPVSGGHGPVLGSTGGRRTAGSWRSRCETWRGERGSPLRPCRTWSVAFQATRLLIERRAPADRARQRPGGRLHRPGADDRLPRRPLLRSIEPERGQSWPDGVALVGYVPGPARARVAAGGGDAV